MFRTVLPILIFAALVISVICGSSESDSHSDSHSSESSNEHHLCGINQHWTTCTPLCPRTCERPNNFCSLRCGRAGCACMEGTVLASPGVCVPPEKCYK